MSAFAYVPLAGRGLVPMRQCRQCGDLFAVLEGQSRRPRDYCPGKDCRAEARRARRRRQYQPKYLTQEAP